MRIVVIEDEYRIRQGLCQLIPKLSPDFELAGSAENGYDGMYLIKEQLPDVAVCDVAMKVMDGLSMIRQLRDLDISCTYLILSGYSEFEYAREAIHLGVAGYLLKPVIPGELKEALLKIEEKLRGDVHPEKDSRERRYSYLVEAAMEEIAKRYQLGVSLNEVAASLRISPEYLSSVFARETGENFVSYLRRYRIEKACQLIRNSNKKMYEIAFLTGFENPQYFSSVFKSVTGMTPKSYMAQYKK